MSLALFSFPPTGGSLEFSDPAQLLPSNAANIDSEEFHLRRSVCKEPSRRLTASACQISELGNQALFPVVANALSLASRLTTAATVFLAVPPPELMR